MKEETKGIYFKRIVTWKGKGWGGKTGKTYGFWELFLIPHKSFIKYLFFAIVTGIATVTSPLIFFWAYSDYLINREIKYVKLEKVKNEIHKKIQ